MARQRALAAGEQRQKLQFLARWLRHDVDVAAQRVVGVRQRQFRAPAAKQLDKRALEILVENGKLALELALHLALEFLDNALQIVLRALQIVPLRGQFLQALDRLAVLVQSRDVDHAHGADSRADDGDALFRLGKAKVLPPQGSASA